MNIYQAVDEYHWVQQDSQEQGRKFKVFLSYNL